MKERHARLGFTLLAVALTFGVGLELLLGFKAQRYLLDPIRRELWTLAHFHGALLGLVNLAYAPWADRAGLSADTGRRASLALATGSVLLPLGFFAGGIGHPEGDPSLGIFLVPLGAVLVIAAIAAQALASWRGRP